MDKKIKGNGLKQDKSSGSCISKRDKPLCDIVKREKFPIRTKPLRMPGEKKKGKEKKKGNIIHKHSEG